MCGTKTYYQDIVDLAIIPINCYGLLEAKNPFQNSNDRHHSSILINYKVPECPEIYLYS